MSFGILPNLRLKTRISAYGIVTPLLAWMKSLFVDRNKTVYLESSTSAAQQVTSVSIQGSILGPILFLLYNDDIK